jgi:hypothetical protein
VTARSAQPVQIPDDLTPPNETNALRLPDLPAESSSPAGECLETPPPFFGESRPFLGGADSQREADRQTRREERRAARREARGEAPADQPSTAPDEPRDRSPADDRVIDN